MMAPLLMHWSCLYLGNRENEKTRATTVYIKLKEQKIVFVLFYRELICSTFSIKMVTPKTLEHWKITEENYFEENAV